MTDESDDLWLFTSYADEDDVAAVTEVIERGTWWAKGPEIETFEDRIADVAGVDHGVAFNSGTSALYAMLVAQGITDGEVVVPSFTFPATANAVVAAEATPIFADIERDSFALDPAAVERAVGPETRAIVPIHFGGDVCAGIHRLRSIADEHDLWLFEDACHSIGATYDGKPVGSFGRAASFSFCFNKILTTGEGGMVVTDSTELRDQLRLIRSHGCTDDNEYVRYGYNLRMSSMTAALGVSQAAKLDWIVGRRREMAASLNDRLEGVAGIERPIFPEERDSVYQLYNLTLEDPRDQTPIRDHLAERGVPTRVTYDPVHLTRYYREEWGWRAGDLPVTEATADRVVTLPFHLELTDENLDRIASGVRTYFE